MSLAQFFNHHGTDALYGALIALLLARTSEFPRWFFWCFCLTAAMDAVNWLAVAVGIKP